ncbi:hypothetical protein T07_12949 [Trichinella nelsoni]|uniref:Uncharacterized protein n=1 Tax=Trichinella nelsoni TaxID=6336 RepID=A0A0V0RAS1_9BILA|nr:hypothetical protein T07_12949 [Trichinella nelsoni]
MNELDVDDLNIPMLARATGIPKRFNYVDAQSTEGNLNHL